jgi:hypothetical protein
MVTRVLLSHINHRSLVLVFNVGFHAQNCMNQLDK